MARRSYDQYCGLARALDILGERWALLVVRELLIGPKRFSDLQDGLPGIGANALSRRLKDLEADGLVSKRRLPPPAASTVYVLTDRGRALEPVVNELIRWGVDLLGPPEPEDSFRPGWLVTGMRAMFDPEAAARVRRSYRLQVDDDVFTIRIDHGTIDVVQGEEGATDLALSTDSDTVLAISSGQLTAEEAVDRGRVSVDRGDPAEVIAFAGMMRLPAGAPA
jgi:DNA-binding HxlR family transcriptional regulator